MDEKYLPEFAGTHLEESYFLGRGRRES